MERKKQSEGHSLPGNRRGRDKLGRGKKATKAGTLMNWRLRLPVAVVLSLKNIAHCLTLNSILRAISAQPSFIYHQFWGAVHGGGGNQRSTRDPDPTSRHICKFNSQLCDLRFQRLKMPSFSFSPFPHTLCSPNHRTTTRCVVVFL